MFGQDLGGAMLAFVTRDVTGDIETTKTKWDAKEGTNKQTVSKVKDPVIVFFPNGTSQVMAMKTAERKGFLERPEVLNLRAVDDTGSIAGKYKFAMSEQERAKYWMMMEQSIVSRCRQKGGEPVPRSAIISNESIWIKDAAPQAFEGEAA